MKPKLVVQCLTLIVVFICTGCSNADKAAVSAWGMKHKVQLFSGGKQIGEWVATGKIENESHSNGYYFQDDKTGKIVIIDGDVIITILDEATPRQ